eukprot:4278173-Karenia_brevis.AAC.1
MLTGWPHPLPTSSPSRMPTTILGAETGGSQAAVSGLVATGVGHKLDKSTARPSHPEGANGHLSSVPPSTQSGKEGQKPHLPEGPRQKP